MSSHNGTCIERCPKSNASQVHFVTFRFPVRIGCGVCPALCPVNEAAAEHGHA
jgi:Fe-S-cluster-containing dehydrogenase component